MKRQLLASMMGVITSLTLAACSGGGEMKPVETVQASGESITLATPTGKISEGDNKLAVTFKDASGNPIEVQSPRVQFFMPAMGTMAAMKSEAELSPTAEPGVYEGTANVEMNGTWQTTIAYQEGGQPQRATFNVMARK